MFVYEAETETGLVDESREISCKKSREVPSQLKNEEALLKEHVSVLTHPACEDTV